MQNIYRIETRPCAKKQNIVQGERYRITMLTEGLLRLEYSEDGIFEDRETQFALFRDIPKTEFRLIRTEDGIEIHTSRIHLKYNEKEFSSFGLNIQVKGNLSVYHSIWRYGEENEPNYMTKLEGTARTLDGADGEIPLESGIIAATGFSILDDSKSQVLLEDGWIEPRKKGIQDIYFWGYGHDYKKALKDFYYLSGNTPMLPRFALGNWWSRYYKYSEESYMELMERFDKENLPFTVAVIDMDWHLVNIDPKYGSGWTGYTWNRKLFPDPKAFADDLHDRGMKVTLNVHPALGIRGSESMYEEMAEAMGVDPATDEPVEFDITNPKFLENYFEIVHHPLEEDGVDFWWLDWHQHLTCSYSPCLGQSFWCNHVFYNDMVKNRPDRRPVIFHRWGGLGSHRYQIGFSGDALINFPTLAFQPYFTSTASNVGYAFWGHDLGGHAVTDEKIVNDPELMLRWIQFGVFTPIFRSHATDDSRIERRIWKFPNFPKLRDAVKLRYALFPYIYTMARETFDTGIGMCRPLYYEYPESEEAYKYEGEYFFGNDILVAPITEPALEDGISSKEIWFPEGKWWSVATDELIEGPCRKTMCFTQEQIPYFFKQGAIIPYNPPTVMNVTERPGHLILNFVSGCKGEGVLYEDDGDNNDYSTVFATTILRQSFKNNKGEYVITPRQGIYTNGVNARSYTFRIYNTTQPVAVKVNGVETSNYSYDVKRKCTNIDIPCTDCTTEVKVRVVYSK